MTSVSIIIPAYESHPTLSRCLQALRGQSWQDFEIVLVDSSVHDHTQAILADFPEVRYHRHSGRLLPFAARNLAIQFAQGEILVSLDPDVYAATDWLARLLACHQQQGAAVAGGVTCYRQGLLDWGAHFCKYHGGLPYHTPGPVGSAASANLLFTREMYTTVGHFRDDLYCSDYLFTRALVNRGYTIWFEPAALVSHDHPVTWRTYLQERYSRGQEFGVVRAQLEHWSAAQALLWTILSVLPIRLARLLLKTGRTAHKGKAVGRYLQALPVTALGFEAWLLGEASAYGQAIISSTLPEREPHRHP
ncbi:MAG: glycosyltransferase [Anaerolineae bacterium]|nr:glycosyltransferase [Anaerolineae bacterium]